MSSSEMRFRRSVAAVIGIDDYGHGVAPLRNAVRDARAVGEALQRHDFEVLSFLGAEASRANLEHLLAERLPSLHPTPDRLFIYFAGHGLAATDDNHELFGFLLPADARRDQEDSYWSMARVLSLLPATLCKHLLLVLDCCFAGTFPHPQIWDLRDEGEPVPLPIERFRSYTAHRSFQILLSTARDEPALDRLTSRARAEVAWGEQHSPFAIALLEALAPSWAAATPKGDSLLTATQLYSYTRDRLIALLAGTGARQTPALRHMAWHDRGEFLFMRPPGAER